jgi:hypothetical protein
MCACIFYFANVNHLKFEPRLNSNRFVLMKRFGNRKALLFPLLALGRNPVKPVGFSFPCSSARPIFLGPMRFSPRVGPGVSPSTKRYRIEHTDKTKLVCSSEVRRARCGLHGTTVGGWPHHRDPVLCPVSHLV